MARPQRNKRRGDGGAGGGGDTNRVDGPGLDNGNRSNYIVHKRTRQQNNHMNKEWY